MLVKHCFFGKLVLEDVNMEYNKKGYTFYRIDEKIIITIADKMDMSNDFHIKHNMHAVEVNLICMINKNITLINKVNRS